MKMTKRIVTLLILSAILLISTIAPGGIALAAEQDRSCAGWYYVDTTTPENHTYSYIYDQPSSTKGKNLGRVDDGEQVYLYWIEKGTGKKDSKWGYCEYDGTKGFIRWDNLSTSKPAPRPTSKPTAKPTAKPTSKPISGAYVEMSGNANIRAGAGKDYKTIGNIGKGMRAEYLNEAKYDERPVLWYKINYNGTVGWVSSMYANLVGGSATPERIYCEGWYTVDTITPANHTYSYIYDKPSSTHGKNLCRVDDGEDVHVYWRERGIGDRSTYWAYCMYDGMKGYIRWDNLY